MQHRETAAAVLRMVRANLSLTQPQRVEYLLAHGDPESVIRDHLTGHLPSVEESLELIDQWTMDNIHVTTVLDFDYPETLRSIREAPAILFSTGRIVRQEVGVSIVGSRNAGPGALQAAADVSRHLASAGVTVISGLAAGVDTAAHQAALEMNGRTVAFMGTGIRHTFPAANRTLRAQIETQGGAVYSQFLPHDRGSRASFPMRNAVMSGYGSATLVIAAEEKSGTRHQVRSAVRHGRDVILSGRVAKETSWGRKYVSQGMAREATSTEHAVELALASARQSQSDLTLFA